MNEFGIGIRGFVAGREEEGGLLRGGYVWTGQRRGRRIGDLTSPGL